MKHVFHIHNQASLFSSLCVIKHNGLAKDDIYFMCFRIEPNLANYGTILDVDDGAYYHKYNSTRHLYKIPFIKNNEIIKNIDDKLSALGDEFTYYVPHCRNPLYSIVITHPKCSQVNYIEDGSDAYLTKKGIQTKFPTRQHFSHWVLSPLFHFFGNKRIIFFPNLYESIGKVVSTSYCLNKHSFNNGLSKKRTQMIIDNNIPSFFSLDVKYNKIFVFDALVEQNILNLDSFKKYLYKFILDYNISLGISVKFHPAQSEIVKKTIFEAFQEKGIELDVLPDDFSFEVFCISNHDKTIFGFGSSVLLYSSFFSKKLTCPLYTIFDKEDVLCQKRYRIWEDMFERDLDVK